MDLALVSVVALAGGLLVAGLVGPLIAQRQLRRTRAPTDEELATLEGLAPEGMALPRDILVIDTVGEDSVEVAIRGPPGRRTLFVTDHVLDELEPVVARALLAGELSRTDLWYREYQVAAASLAIGLGSAGFLLVVPFEAGFGGMLVVAAVMLAGGRRLQYRADARAAAIVGADALADAFETVARRHDADLSRGGWRTYFEVQPPIGDRIHRLRDGG